MLSKKDVWILLGKVQVREQRDAVKGSRMMAEDCGLTRKLWWVKMPRMGQKTLNNERSSIHRALALLQDTEGGTEDS